MAALHALDHQRLPEARLVELARGGDRDAFRAIMTRCNQRLFRVARAVVRDEAEAEDVLQEAYARAFAAIAGFRGEAGVATWLTRIVLNEAHGRLRKRRPVVDLEALETGGAEVLAFPGLVRREDPEADAARAQIRRLLERAVDDLPEPFRLVFILREIEELSVEETARHLGVKVDTVKTRLHRARLRLRQALDAQLADVMVGAYPFLGARCARITEAVLARLDACGALPPAGG
ncbi:RNA polymerase sigma factor [Phenylobacterium sp.]|jgi:RNA polymerase sigma-70 factor (ECF subfamily)|uniref:RNA polymerase sigma factor n=1 Tax=Phenylobacterium sp. TaxID=1871053 RepID=UPI002F4046CD